MELAKVALYIFIVSTSLNSCYEEQARRSHINALPSAPAHAPAAGRADK